MFSFIGYHKELNDLIGEEVKDFSKRLRESQVLDGMELELEGRKEGRKDDNTDNREVI